MKCLTTAAITLTLLCVAAPSSAQTRASDYQIVNVCNRHGETIYISYGWGILGPVEGSFDVKIRGWGVLKPGECNHPRLPKYIDAQVRVKSALFIYAETKGIFGGAIKKTWEGNDWTGCMLRSREGSWTTTSYSAGQGLVIKNTCDASDRFSAGMTRLEDRNSAGEYSINFGGN